MSVFVETFTHTYRLSEEGFGYNYRRLKSSRNEAIDRFCSTVVFLLNELFVTVHADDILNTDNNK